MKKMYTEKRRGDEVNVEVVGHIMGTKVTKFVVATFLSVSGYIL
jgi:hypothetical protein